ncbi:hypothetical protein [Chitinophaga sp. Ak27]|uniref:hypothetical protein n=1 Tax=Chitinophaga sp. Ak27 TaxID=2726116 RepID=UPI00145E1343|nr:hypothetical protein [Chitinophaga sp. Ak27]NLU95558.1 hypothetical protein [Chitinophaga sp. Ak27]
MNITNHATNVLLTLHTELSKLPVIFREQVCEECNFSTPTFYRKMRGIDRRVDGRLIPALSNAEKQKIREVGEGVTKALVASIFGDGEK